MAEYVYSGVNVFHVPARIDPQGDPEKSTPGAMFVPGVPTELDDRDAQNPAVKQLMESQLLRPAEDADKQRAKEVDDERRRENAQRDESEAKNRGQQGSTPTKR